MTEVERRFERVGGRTLWSGRIVSVSRDRFRYADGVEVEREIVHHPGAVGMVAHDHTHVWLVRQPRETISDPDVLEIPAGKLDVPGEPPLETARRELAEEIGKAAGTWEPILDFVTSVGVMDEVVHLFRATGLRDDDSGATGRARAHRGRALAAVRSQRGAGRHARLQDADRAHVVARAVAVGDGRRRRGPP